jgi:hypothetical protein
VQKMDRLKVTDATGSVPLATRQARGQRRLLVSYRKGDAFDLEISANLRPGESKASTCWRLVSCENRLRIAQLNACPSSKSKRTIASHGEPLVIRRRKPAASLERTNPKCTNDGSLPCDSRERATRPHRDCPWYLSGTAVREYGAILLLDTATDDGFDTAEDALFRLVDTVDIDEWHPSKTGARVYHAKIPQEDRAEQMERFKTAQRHPQKELRLDLVVSDRSQPEGDLPGLVSVMLRGQAGGS